MDDVDEIVWDGQYHFWIEAWLGKAFIGWSGKHDAILVKSPANISYIARRGARIKRVEGGVHVYQ